MSRSQQGLYPHRCRPIPHLSWPLLLCVCVRNLRAERFYCVRPIRIVAGVMNTTSPPPSSPKWEIERKKSRPEKSNAIHHRGPEFRLLFTPPFSSLSLSHYIPPGKKKPRIQPNGRERSRNAQGTDSIRPFSLLLAATLLY